MIPPGYPEALAQYASTHPDGCSIISDALDSAVAEMQSGESGTVVSCSINSHAFTFSGTLTVEEKVTALQDAFSQCQCLTGEGEPPTEDWHYNSFQVQH